jgi:hypothetical protein
LSTKSSIEADRLSHFSGRAFEGYSNRIAQAGYIAFVPIAPYRAVSIKNYDVYSSGVLAREA